MKAREIIEKLIANGCDTVDGFDDDICFFCGASMRHEAQHKGDCAYIAAQQYLKEKEPEFITCPRCGIIMLPEEYTEHFCEEKED